MHRLPLPTYAAPVRASAGSFDYRYPAEARARVVSDNAWHTLALSQAQVSATAEYVTVPSVELRTYRTVRLKNRSTFALLAGPVAVMVGDEFLMSVPLPTLAPGGEERCGLGVEEGVRVARNTRFSETTGGLLGGTTVAEHAVDVEVHNTLLHPVRIEVRERVPVARETDIKIEETGVAPAWERLKPEDGVPIEGERLWRLTLAPQQKTTLKAGYTARFPGGKMLVGGNRRD